MAINIIIEDIIMMINNNSIINKLYFNTIIYINILCVIRLSNK
jgi:hypothetical protein